MASSEGRERRFPIQAEFHLGGRWPKVDVPWEVAERAYDVYHALGHGSQSLERLAERGGFGYVEFVLLLAERDPWGDGAPISARAAGNLARRRGEA